MKTNKDQREWKLFKIWERKFKPGDKVRVLRIACNGELGWENSWESPMNRAVGHVMTVIADAGPRGVALGGRWDKEPGEDVDKWPYYYPPQVLRLVKTKTGRRKT